MTGLRDTGAVFASIVASALLMGCTRSCVGPGATEEVASMRLTSPAFAEGRPMPDGTTRYGDDRSPPT